MNEIRSISPEFGQEGISLNSNKNTAEHSFKDLLVNNLNNTNELLKQADKLSEDFTLGKNTDIHKVMIAMERAQVSLQYTVQVRNKLIEGFQELMRTQV